MFSVILCESSEIFNKTVVGYYAKAIRFLW